MRLSSEHYYIRLVYFHQFLPFSCAALTCVRAVCPCFGHSIGLSNIDRNHIVSNDRPNWYLSIMHTRARSRQHHQQWTRHGRTRKSGEKPFFMWYGSCACHMSASGGQVFRFRVVFDTSAFYTQFRRVRFRSSINISSFLESRQFINL